ncbi:FHA domain-containing protein PS1 [Cinnamomum micranthum f. kanehirae]|uniref:FHA domain-containing protein PS1 n=1 Tax=Cinnamomum micranthum f. kanehirae TaxID=337451 RepID=A0A3S3MP75_9MAGN|nr:FHA domain-containing protein PS1 [Cinnamomum micranthum f. kanehirae]
MPLGVLLASEAQLEVEHCSLEARFTTEVLSEGENRSPLRRSDSVSFLYAHTRREGGSDAGIEAENQKGNMYVEQDKGEEENQKNILGSFSASHAAESVSSSIPVRVLSASDAQLEKEHSSLEACLATEVQFEEENQSPPQINSGQRDMSNIWSRRGKSAKLIQLHTGRKVTSHAGIKADKQKEIMYVEQDKREDDTLFKALFFGADEEDEPIPSDKENMTPQGHPNLKLEKGKLKIKEPELLKSSLEVIDADSDVEDNVFSADKENRTLKLSYEMKSKKQTSENQKRIRPDMMNQSVDQAVLKAGQSKRKWYMVVDTSCLLNEESRRSLKLLEGIKGTQLLIPRMVIRELDCLRRRGSWFKKENEASSILQWIGECMTKMRWWIHVQSSTEGMPVAPTPPASPRSRLSEGSNEFGTTTSVPFSTCGSLMEIVSPTAEDHILECALCFKRIKNDGQLVLLTNDTALKIKAMAEGLICESAKEFRDSLVNPYSERFLWVESTPIGPTWSCVEGTGKKENYNYRPPIKKTVKAAEGAKGLKLILLHNSHYGQIDPVK